jgi:hypothetical protein
LLVAAVLGKALPHDAFSSSIMWQNNCEGEKEDPGLAKAGRVPGLGLAHPAEHHGSLTLETGSYIASCREEAD